MTRPAVTHDGFLIPNANGVAEPVLAEPDQIDFNTLANAQWGVIEGCEVNSQSPKTVAISDGTAIVNGKLVLVTGSELPLPTPGANGQFVLVVVDDGGHLKLNTSAVASVDPVFPDPEVNETVLASVYCDATASTFANNIVDKRKLLSKSLLTKIPVTDELIRNANNAGNHFKMLGDGTMSWEDDTFLKRSTAATVLVWDNIDARGDITAEQDLNAGGNVAATGLLTGSNFRRGAGAPTSSGNNGDLFVSTSTGNLYIWINGAWSQFASMSATQGVVPIGTVIFCMQGSSTMINLGWYPMNGTQTLSEDTHPAIFNIPIGGTITGTAPHRTLTLPNLNRRTLMVDFRSPHAMGGVDNNSVRLGINQIPKHNHNVGGVAGRTSSDNKHTPSVSVDPLTGSHTNHAVTGGYHDHPVYDSGHTHNGMDWFGVSAPIIAWVGFDGTPQDGKNKLDAMFNDSSHTYTVEPVRWTMKATTGIDIGPNTEHTHSVTGGAHSHSLTIGEVAAHFHTVSEADVGLDPPQAIDITPQNYTVYAYIRA